MTDTTASQPAPIWTVSVRDIVSQSMRSGDLNPVFTSSARAVQGSIGHRIVQQSRAEGYQAEFSLAEVFTIAELAVRIQGRADGIMPDNSPPLIDEIKTTTRELETIDPEAMQTHWAQAAVYAALYARQNDLPAMAVQLTYYQLESGKTREFKQLFERDELELLLAMLLADYLVWARRQLQWQTERNHSLNALDFPFPSYRTGQRDMAVAVWRQISAGGQALLQAPTGIGKTVAVLFPAAKALGENRAGRIIFATAKTVGRFVAGETLALLRTAGARLRAVTLTAKDKICFSPDTGCDPEACPYARGHFDRLNGALSDGLEHEVLDRARIEALAQAHTVCPFELSLDLAMFADVVIGDYNYVFDPRVALQRLVEEDGNRSILLVDEAHNLVDRARDMYSAQLDKRPLLDLKRVIGEHWPGGKRALNAVNSAFVELRKQCEAEDTRELVLAKPPEMLVKALRGFSRAAEKWLTEQPQSPVRPEVLDAYFDCNRFLRTVEWVDERYRVLVTRHGQSGLRCRLFCTDPAPRLKERLDGMAASILFSATLAPLPYFRRMLGLSQQAGLLALPSPFPLENRLLMIQPTVATTYKQRDGSYTAIAESIRAATRARTGNYLVFFPSYRYLQDVLTAFESLTDSNECDLIVQTSGMSETEREAFLARFQPEPGRSQVGFAVMGGLFGEGIDLVGERLNGALVVGVGLPQVCLEREQIRKHFDEMESDGFAYAYQYPGINRVLQAAGRVIRSERDKGVILAIDQRFAYGSYRRLLPPDWADALIVKNEAEIADALAAFWDGNSGF